MPYAGSATILDIIPGIASSSTWRNSQTEETVNRHLVRADDWINGYLSRRYSVPFTTTTGIPPLVISIADDLVSGWTYRSFFSQDSQNRNAWWEDLLKKAQATLEALAKGELDLVFSSGALVGEANRGDKVDSSTENYFPFFEVDAPTSWKLDQDRLDTISSSRN